VSRYAGFETKQIASIQARIEAAIGRGDALAARAYALELLGQVAARDTSAPHHIQVFGLLLATVALLGAAIESENTGAPVDPKL